MTNTAARPNGQGSTSPNPSGEKHVIASELLELLVCPVDHAKLNLVGETLVCTVCQRVYPIEQGIPNMIVSEEV